jgi:hypothetical protein
MKTFIDELGMLEEEKEKLILKLEISLFTLNAKS